MTTGRADLAVSARQVPASAAPASVGPGANARFRTAGPGRPYTSIVVATDGSPAAATLHLAGGIAADCAAVLHVVGAYWPRGRLITFGPEAAWVAAHGRAGWDRDVHAGVEDMLRRVVAETVGDRVRTLTHAVPGPALHALLQVAVAECADLIVVGDRVGGRMRGPLTGRARRQRRDLGCDLLVVHHRLKPDPGQAGQPSPNRRLSTTRWDGNDNLAQVVAAQRVRPRGEVFVVRTTKGNVRENHVVEFAEGALIALDPGRAGTGSAGAPVALGLEPPAATRTRVRHTYDWTRSVDAARLPRARATTPDRLQASLDRLAAIAQST
jgi:hypothetical protein